ncbi:hypothetical protein ACNS7O_13810 [Haloferacaceae archaeon DSL9]
MQGSENARLCCPEGSTGVWNWILTGGGATFIEATLTVEFDDGETVTVDGEFPGIGNVAQFPVIREFDADECITAVAAEAEFTLDSPPMGNQVLTISDSECVDVPPKPPKKKKHKKKHEKKRAEKKYLRKKVMYKHRKEMYKKAEKEYKKAKKDFEKKDKKHKKDKKNLDGKKDGKKNGKDGKKRNLDGKNGNNC